MFGAAVGLVVRGLEQNAKIKSSWKGGSHCKMDTNHGQSARMKLLARIELLK